MRTVDYQLELPHLYRIDCAHTTTPFERPVMAHDGITIRLNEGTDYSQTLSFLIECVNQEMVSQCDPDFLLHLARLLKGEKTPWALVEVGIATGYCSLEFQPVTRIAHQEQPRSPGVPMSEDNRCVSIDFFIEDGDLPKKTLVLESISPYDSSKTTTVLQLGGFERIVVTEVYAHSYRRLRFCDNKPVNNGEDVHSIVDVSEYNW